MLIGIVHGHASKLLFGILEPGALPVVLMVGRVQFVITCSDPRSVKSAHFDVCVVSMKGTQFRVLHFLSGS